jgi:multiple sugar transport system permease protein
MTSGRLAIQVKRPEQRTLAIRRRFLPYALLLPAAMLVITLNVLTSAYGIYMSFLDYSYLRPDHLLDFVGLKHYVSIATDPTFLAAAYRTIIWCAVVVPGGFVVGLSLALLLNEVAGAKMLFRTMVLMPWAAPLIVAGVAWYFIFAPGIGPLDDLLFRLGMPEMKYMGWLGSQEFAFPIVMVAQIWRYAPFFAITLLAGLQSIPSDLYEVAEIDGAGMIARFRYITMPLLRPVAAVVLLQGVIASIHNFTLVYVMTRGGPALSTEVLSVYLWRQAFNLAEVGRGAGVGTILVLILSVVGSIWVLKMIRQETRG